MTTRPPNALRIAVVYYSARGNVHGLARAVTEGAASVGVEVRLRHVAEQNQELLISAKQYWGRHRCEIEHEPDARLEDIEWADGIAFGDADPVRAPKPSSCCSCLTTRRRPGQQDEAIERYRLRSNQPGSRQ